MFISLHHVNYTYINYMMSQGKLTQCILFLLAHHPKIQRTLQIIDMHTLIF